MSKQPALRTRTLGSINEISADDWDACAACSGIDDTNDEGRGNDCAGQGDPPAPVQRQKPRQPYPFVSHAFLKAMEDSSSVRPGVGWAPQHLLVEDANARILACMPCYQRTINGGGDWLEDWQWYYAHNDVDENYYPTLLSGAPFTPVSSRRILLRNEGDFDAIAPVLIRHLAKLTHKNDLSSFHLSFCEEREWRRLGTTPGADPLHLTDSENQPAVLQHVHRNFYWPNNDYDSFEDFLGALTSRKRKMIRKERRAIASSGVKIERLTGADIKPHHWRFFLLCYEHTFAKKSSSPYLNHAFFEQIARTMQDDLLLVFCSIGDTPVAVALNYIGENTLYGRYWGCMANMPFLYFEACFYQGMEYAIENGLRFVQGGWGTLERQKMARGYLPENSYSLHYFKNPLLRLQIAHMLHIERFGTLALTAELQQQTAYRSGG